MIDLKFRRSEDIPIVFLMGGTATGKTDIAALLSQQIPFELISVDSSLVYAGMNIGTAKPDANFLKEFPHHLIDIRKPDQTYSVADFCEDSIHLITKITSNGKVPLFVGGTSFYFSALENGLPDLPEKDEAIRHQILTAAETKGWSFLHEQLANIDPQRAARINVTDTQRIQRALEINYITGQPVTEKKSECLFPNPLIKIALVHFDRKVLHQRIEKRFHIMVEQGLIEEIENLIAVYARDIPAFRMIGYRQFIDGLEQGDSIDTIIEKSIIATRQLAKRQLTWLRNQSGLLWYGVNNEDLAMTASSIADYCHSRFNLHFD